MKIDTNELRELIVCGLHESWQHDCNYCNGLEEICSSVTIESKLVSSIASELDRLYAIEEATGKHPDTDWLLQEVSTMKITTNGKSSVSRNVRDAVIQLILATKPNPSPHS